MNLKTKSLVVSVDTDKGFDKTHHDLRKNSWIGVEGPSPHNQCYKPSAIHSVNTFMAVDLNRVEITAVELLCFSCPVSY